MKYYYKEYASPVPDDRAEFLIDRYRSGENEQYRIIKQEHSKEHSSKLFLVYAFVIILALYICVYEFQLQAIFITYVLIALTYGVMAIGYYYEYK
jgi:hypothetical protein